MIVTRYVPGAVGRVTGTAIDDGPIVTAVGATTSPATSAMSSGTPAAGGLIDAWTWAR